jgi:SAM-dependent methyltransferase
VKRVVHVLGATAGYALGRVYERRYRVATEEAPDVDSLWYEPSEWRSVRRAFRGLNAGRDDVLVDFGSGKGRVLLMAAEFPFRRVIGVEISQELNDLAREHIESNRSRRRCEEVELVTANALDYEVPDDVTVAYFFNPFIGDTFMAVVRKLIDSVNRVPRELRLLYNYPIEHNRLLATGRALVLDVQASELGASRLGAEVIITYLLTASGSDPMGSAHLRTAPKRLRGAEAWTRQYDPGFELGGKPLTDRQSFLATLDFFSGCTERQLGDICRLAEERALPAGAELCRQGDFENEVFVIVDGSATRMIDRVAVGTIQKGEIVGELSMSGNGRRSATALVVEPMRVLVFEPEEIASVVLRTRPRPMG